VTSSEAVDAVRGISFGGGLSLWRPRMEAHLEFSSFGGVVVESVSVVMTCEFPDRDDPSKRTDVHFVLKCDVHASAILGSVAAWLEFLRRNVVLFVATHEADESFLHNGRRVTESHHKEPHAWAQP